MLCSGLQTFTFREPGHYYYYSLQLLTGVSRTIAVCLSPSLLVFGDLQAEHNWIFFAGRIR